MVVDWLQADVCRSRLSRPETKSGICYSFFFQPNATAVGIR